MTTFTSPRRAAGANPPVVPSDDEIVRAQARARRERSEAFGRAVRWSIDRVRRFAA